MQVLTQAGCLFSAVEDAPCFILLQWEIFLADPAQEVADARVQ